MAKPRTGFSKNKAWQGQGGVQPQHIASFIVFFQAFSKIKLNLSYQVFTLTLLCVMKKEG